MSKAHNPTEFIQEGKPFHERKNYGNPPKIGGKQFGTDPEWKIPSAEAVIANTAKKKEEISKYDSPTDSGSLGSRIRGILSRVRKVKFLPKLVDNSFGLIEPMETKVSVCQCTLIEDAEPPGSARKTEARAVWFQHDAEATKSQSALLKTRVLHGLSDRIRGLTSGWESKGEEEEVHTAEVLATCWKPKGEARDPYLSGTLKSDKANTEAGLHNYVSHSAGSTQEAEAPAGVLGEADTSVRTCLTHPRVTAGRGQQVGGEY
jgi:hypothetical protein